MAYEKCCPFGRAICTLFDKCVNFINSILPLQTLCRTLSHHFYRNFIYEFGSHSTAVVAAAATAPSMILVRRNYIRVSWFVLEKQRIAARFHISMKLQLCHLGMVLYVLDDVKWRGELNESSILSGQNTFCHCLFKLGMELIIYCVVHVCLYVEVGVGVCVRAQKQCVLVAFVFQCN